MKNHTYHYKMRPIWKGMRERKTNNTVFGHLWENGVGCPIGTVPIRRVTKEDILALNSLDDKYKPHGSWNTSTSGPKNVLHPDQHYHAVGRTKGKGMRYNGATMDLCITAPQVKPTQHSASRIHFQMGDDFIQAGITVNPVLYKDHNPRIYVFTKAGEKSCFNNHCDVGMISVRQDLPLGMALSPVSIRAMEAYSTTFGLIKDQASGNWWLLLGRKSEQIGVWPEQIFGQTFGDKVEWGGEVFRAWLPSPQMGFGYFPTGKRLEDAYIKRISILDGNFQYDRQVNNIEAVSDNTRGYGVKQKIDKDIETGRVIYYGGPGNV
ncbi:unnamed protein product [Microthlaspi erraticum]|uniref:Neprosin PEP catalytic domain-containing protein n=1 Tax=Microthlaspi erraticum TaxID=1685480 RepID=A0A6D2JZZ7_9BRAS|nr:unnamed protein product [Microthlaspi erraticum]